MELPKTLDPFGGAQLPRGRVAPLDPDMPTVMPDGSIIIPATFHAKAFVEQNLLTTDGVDNLITVLSQANEAQDAKQRADAAQALLEPLQAQAKLVPQLQAEVAKAAVEAVHLRDALTAALANGPAPKSEPAVDEDGTPIPGAELLPVDPYYSIPPWFAQKAEPRLKQFGRRILGLIGAAGVGKTKGLLEWAARAKVPCAYLNCKGADPNEWFEYRSVDNGTTSWTPGVLTKLIQLGRKVLIIIDEPDTSAGEFQMRLASLLEANPNQRRITTPFGTFTCPPNIQFCLAMNGNGTNPSSRHRGALTPALVNRITWIQAPMVQAAELDTILARAHPTIDSVVRANIAECIVRLMVAAQRGTIDVDCSIRTALKVCDDWSLGEQVAWDGAILDAMDDPQMRAKAVAALADRFTLA